MSYEVHWGVKLKLSDTYMVGGVTPLDFLIWGEWNFENVLKSQLHVFCIYFNLGPCPR